MCWTARGYHWPGGTRELLDERRRQRHLIEQRGRKLVDDCLQLDRQQAATTSRVLDVPTNRDGQMIEPIIHVARSPSHDLAIEFDKGRSARRHTRGSGCAADPLPRKHGDSLWIAQPPLADTRLIVARGEIQELLCLGVTRPPLQADCRQASIFPSFCNPNESHRSTQGNRLSCHDEKNRNVAFPCSFVLVVVDRLKMQLTCPITRVGLPTMQLAQNLLNLNPFGQKLSRAGPLWSRQAIALALLKPAISPNNHFNATINRFARQYLCSGCRDDNAVRGCRGGRRAVSRTRI